LLYFLNCTSPRKSKSDLEINNLKGDVILTIDDFEKVFYNDHGYITKKLNDLNKDLPVRTVYNYVDGKLSSIESNAKDYYSKMDYIYDKTGVLEKTIDNIDITGTKRKDVTFYRFDKKGNKILDSSITKDRSRLIPIFFKYYYSNNQIDSSEMTFLGGSKSYFKNGNEIKTIVYDIDKGKKTLRNIVTYFYQYDGNGNWIKKMTYINGELADTINRKIFYKGQDINQYEKLFDKL